MKKFKMLLCLLLGLLLLASGCFSYTDMNRLLFYTMGAGDYKDGEFFFYGEAYKAYRGEGEKSGKEKRIVIFGKGKSLCEAVEQMRDSVNYPIEYAVNKTFVFTKGLAEHGLGDYLDIFDRDQKPSLRMYLSILDGNIHDLVDVQMEEELFMGLFLYQMMNSQQHALSVVTDQYYTFLNNLKTGSGVNVIPILKLTNIDDQTNAHGQGDGTEQGHVGGSQASGENPSAQKYITVDGAAVFVKTKMAAQINRQEAEIYKLLTGAVNSGIINMPNPDVSGALVGFTVLKNKYHYKVTKQDERLRVDVKLDVRLVLLEAQQGISGSDETADKLKSGAEAEIRHRAQAFIASMCEKDIDIVNVMRKAQLAHIELPSEHYLNDTDFYISVNVTIDGLGKQKEAYY